MPSPKRRGPHPQDGALFGPATIPALRRAVADLSWLRSRGYAEPSALKLVGDRYQLTTRQRSAVGRSACSDQGLRTRSARKVALDETRDRALWIDGFNLLITLEAALAGGVLLRGRDGCLRDLSSLHGNYHVLADTEEAIRLACACLAEAAPGRAIWFLDKPVSNSGRLAGCIRNVACHFPSCPTQVLLVPDPDRLLLAPPANGETPVVVSSDSLILAADVPWLNLAACIVERCIPEARVIDLAPPNGTEEPA